MKVLNRSSLKSPVISNCVDSMELRSQIKQELGQLSLEAVPNHPIPLDHEHEEASHDQSRLRNIRRLPVARAGRLQLEQHTKCATTTETKPYTRNSLLTRLPCDEGPKQCPYCDRKFFRLLNFEAHMQTHAGEVVQSKQEVETSDSEDLTELFNTSTDFQLQTETGESEILTVKGRNKKRKCNLCQKVMSGRTQLSRHMSAVHLKLKPYKCQYCVATFARQDQTSEHERRHTGERPFKCDLCSSAFHDRSTLNRHRVTHSETATSYECCICRVFFTSLQASARHTRGCH